MNSYHPKNTTVELRVEGMRYNIVTALTEAERDVWIQEAIEKATRPKNVKQVIQKEIERFFKYNGEGRKIIAQAVKEKLIGDLDDVEL